MYRDDQARCILIVRGSVRGCWRGLGNMSNLTLTSIKRGFTIVAPGFDIVQKQPKPRLLLSYSNVPAQLPPVIRPGDGVGG